MAADDKYYLNVREALFKDGWTLSKGGVSGRVPGMYVLADIAAERVVLELENEKRREKIIVEVKSFIGKSFVQDFHLAVGKYCNYTYVFGKTQPDRKIWLAIPEDTYQKHFMSPALIDITTRHSISILTFDQHINRIIRWIPK
jgi:hypothetical protein